MTTFKFKTPLPPLDRIEHDGQTARLIMADGTSSPLPSSIEELRSRADLVETPADTPPQANTAALLRGTAQQLMDIADKLENRGPASVVGTSVPSTNGHHDLPAEILRHGMTAS